MAAALQLVSRNQKLKLALKSLFFSLGVFWWQATGSWWAVLLALIILSLTYFYPLAQSSRFLTAFLMIASWLFIYPALDLPKSWWLTVLAGMLVYTVAGLKELLFVNRKLISQLLYFFILGTLVYFFLLNPGVANQIIFFILASLLISELYRFLLEEIQLPPMLIAAVYAFLAVELGWAISLLPVARLSATLVIIAFLFMIHHLLVQYQLAALNRRVFLRDLVLWLALVIIVIGTTRWHLS